MRSIFAIFSACYLSLICNCSSALALDYEDPELIDWEEQIVDQIQMGFETLINQDPWRAAVQFETAKQIVAQYDSKDNNYTFFIACGQVIAFDCLGLHQKCAKACQKMAKCFLSSLKEEFEANEDDSELNSEDEEKWEKFIETVTKAIYTTPSPLIKDYLLLLIEPSEEALTSLLDFL